MTPAGDTRRWGPGPDPTDPDWHPTIEQHEVPPAPDLTVGADPPEVGRLYGPDGALLAIVRAPDHRLPLGFR